MSWQIEFSKTSIKQLKKLDPQVRRKIVFYLKEKVAVAPRELGATLKNELSGFWKYRVADYRIICEHQDDKLIVLVLRVGHRKELYRN